MKDQPTTSRNLGIAWLVTVLTVATPWTMAAQDTPTAPDRRIVQEGIAIELALETIEQDGERQDLREGDTVAVRFQVTDTHTQTPLSGVYPAAWMDRRTEGEGSDPGICRDKVEAFVGGSLFAPPELDLNVYYVLALNSDPTISVVDPLFGFGTTKLLDMIFLEAPGEDWVLSEDQLTLFVSMPDVNQVAVASTSTWEVSENLSVGPRPSRVAIQADGRYLWVGFDGPRDGLSGVTVVDTAGPKVVANILTGRGHHEIALSGDNRWAFISNQDDATVSIIDVAKLATVATLPVGREPVSLAYSEMAGAAFVSSRADGTITVIDALSQKVVGRIEAEPGLGQIGFAPGDQVAFAVNTELDKVYIVDAATQQIAQTADVEVGPDQVTFSDHLAYIRHRGSEIVLMIPLEQIGTAGAPVPLIDFPGGQAAFGRGSRPSPAAGIVQAPGATAVLVANPADKTIYFYKEGMAAPMGNFQNYNRQPRAVLAVDRSLEERAPGSYETIATLRRPGIYDVAFFLDSPRTIHCFEVEVAANPELEAARQRLRPIEVRPMFGGQVLAHGDKVDLPAGETTALEIQLIDPVTGTPRSGLADVRVLTFRSPGRNQERRLARPLGDGRYQVDLLLPHPGVYYAFVESDSAGLRYNQSPQVILVATDTTQTTDANDAADDATDANDSADDPRAD